MTRNPRMKTSLDAVAGSACKATVSTMVQSDLWAAIETARAEYRRADEIPAGWISTEQYKDLFGLNESTARRELLRLVKAGKLQTKIASYNGYKIRCWGVV